MYLKFEKHSTHEHRHAPRQVERWQHITELKKLVKEKGNLLINYKSLCHVYKINKKMPTIHLQTNI